MIFARSDTTHWEKKKAEPQFDISLWQIKKSKTGNPWYFIKTFENEYQGLQTSFTLLGNGNFNVAYKFQVGDSYFVLKIPLSYMEPDGIIEYPAKADTPLRTARLWNEIYKDTLCEAIAVDFTGILEKPCSVLIMPFISGVNPETSDIIESLIFIYLKNRRIVVDAMALGNFIKINDELTVCIDVSFAIRLQDDLEHESQINFERSITSLEFWDSTKKIYDDWFKKYMMYKPQYLIISNTIKALLMIEKMRFSMFNDIKSYVAAIPLLAAAYEDTLINNICADIKPSQSRDLAILGLLEKTANSQQIKDSLCRLYLIISRSKKAEPATKPPSQIDLRDPLILKQEENSTPGANTVRSSNNEENKNEGIPEQIDSTVGCRGNVNLMFFKPHNKKTDSSTAAITPQPNNCN